MSTTRTGPFPGSGIVFFLFFFLLFSLLGFDRRGVLNMLVDFGRCGRPQHRRFVRSGNDHGIARVDGHNPLGHPGVVPVAAAAFEDEPALSVLIETDEHGPPDTADSRRCVEFESRLPTQFVHHRLGLASKEIEVVLLTFVHAVLGNAKAGVLRETENIPVVQGHLRLGFAFGPQDVPFVDRVV